MTITTFYRTAAIAAVLASGATAVQAQDAATLQATQNAYNAVCTGDQVATAQCINLQSQIITMRSQINANAAQVQQQNNAASMNQVQGLLGQVGGLTGSYKTQSKANQVGNILGQTQGLSNGTGNLGGLLGSIGNVSGANTKTLGQLNSASNIMNTLGGFGAFAGGQKKQAAPTGTGNIGGMLSGMAGGSSKKTFSKKKIKRDVAKLNGISTSKFSIEDYKAGASATTFRIQMNNGQSVSCSLAATATTVGDANCS